MSQRCVFLEKQVGSHLISLTFSPASNSFSATIRNSSGNIVPFDSSQIKCGISGKVSHQDFIRRVDQVAREKLAAFVHPSEGQPTEIWVFEATPLTASVIKNAREHLKHDDLEQGIQQFEIVLKLEQQQKGDTVELSSTIVQLKKELFLIKSQNDAPLYLPLEETVKFNEVIKLYRDQENPFPLWSQYLETRGLEYPHLYYLSACLNEHEDNRVEAAPQYLYLALKHLNPIPILRKAAALIQTSSDPFAFPHFLEKLDRHWLSSISSNTPDPEIQKWVLQKDAIRMAFEECLAELSRCSTQPQAPTCFICFNVEERDVGQWLEHTLVPDLDQIGVKPLFCFRDLGPGKELNDFQAMIRNADQVIIACTPELKRKCVEREQAPTGVAQEIRIARERFNDQNKHQSIFPLYLKGKREASCPSPFFEPILGTNFTCLDNSTSDFVFSYYAQAFELFAMMRKISGDRDQARRMKDAFLVKTRQILSGQINESAIREWQNSRARRTREILHSAQEKALQQTPNIPSSALQPQGLTPASAISDDLRIVLQKLRKEIQENEYRQNERVLYIESDCVSDISLIYRSDAATSLRTTFGKFMRGPKKVLLLQAFAGSGKTMFTEEIEEELLTKFDPKNPESRIPLRIELGGLTDPVNNAIEEGLINKGFSKEQIQQLEQLPVVIILDGVDEARKDGKRLSPTHHLYFTNKLYRFKNAKVVFGLRVGGSSEGRVDPNQFRPYRSAVLTSVENENSLEKVVICPFTEEKIKRYILQYVSKAPQEWKQKFARWIVQECAFFFQMIREIQGASDLAKIPFTLRLLAQYLPSIIEEATQGASSLNATSLKITESQVYELFLSHWFEREKQKLVGKTLPDEFNEQTPEEFAWSYCMHLAKTMSLEGENHVGITQVVYKKKLPFTTRDENRFKKWDDFFSDEPIPWTCQRLAPLRRSDQGGQITYSFIHPFIQDFLVARKNKIETDTMGV